MQYHLARQVQLNITSGMNSAEARKHALRSFGGLGQAKEQCRDARGVRLLEEAWLDIGYGLRLLCKNTGFTFNVVTILALSIGANTAIFQLLDAVRMRTLPVQAPQELAEIRITDKTGARGSFDDWHATATNPLWEQLRSSQQAFSGIFAWGTNSLNLASGGEARYAQAL